jgi:outer membrane protein assembly factor BamB
LKNGLLRLNRIFGREAAAATPAPVADTTCPHCGAVIPRSRRCPVCNNPTFSLPGWARSGRERRIITRKRLIVSGCVLAALLFVLWVNYPFLPNYDILLFHRPSTEASSNSALGRWSMAGGDLAQRKAALNAGNAQTLPAGRVRWQTPTGEGTRAGPIVANGVVYQGAYFKIVALDAATGEVIWSQPTSGPVQTSLALAGDRLYAGFLDHRVRALEPATGEVLWEFRTGDIITASPVVHGGILYLGAWDNVQYALDAATGAVIWTYEASDKVSSHSPVAGGVTAVPDKGGKIHLLDARTGQNRLVYRTPKSTNAAPVMAHDRVYFAAGGRLYAIDATAKEVPGQYQFKRVWAQLWLWQVPGVPRPAGQQGGLWRFSPEGNDSSIVASPSVSSSRLYVGDLDGRLYAVDPATGVEQWRFQANGGIYASPIVAGNTVYVATQQGWVYAVDGESGAELWNLRLDAGVNEPLAFAAGTLYVRTAEGTVVAIE